ncbi:UDP-N-acetylmuramate dehydrogenase [Synechococcus sp. PCC 7336]|uniref:UDP-N-acetylmuramate dehydrogenase n=1 Tax=Synechococcus sp. PCC 7336 TaxID=195250 RepID=UPI000346D7BF|nr:UDP-N-acetylmuramate dehydrogenase [Synechococcus sp. PCC 7336]
MTQSSRNLPPPCVAAQISLAPYTTFRVGGAAEWLGLPRSPQELHDSLAWAQSQDLVCRFMGLGSNLLIGDRGLPGLTLSTRKLKQVKALEDGKLWVEAGASAVKLAHTVADWGWSGLEWAVGVPGTLGGMAVMNAGAHGCETKDVLVSVDILDESLQSRTLDPQELDYRYRDSLLQHRPWIVTAATFQLEPDRDPEQVRAQTQAFWEIRHSTQPYDWPSCGSVFRNPYPQTAGWLIEQTGLKGYQLGGAQVSEKHANFIINRDRATATDIYRLIEQVREQVYERWDIMLHPEVRVLGEFD